MERELLGNKMFKKGDQIFADLIYLSNLSSSVLKKNGCVDSKYYIMIVHFRSRQMYMI